MSESVSPETARSRNQTDGMNPRYAAGRTGQTSPIVTENRRPGLITFAAIMMFVASAFMLVWAIQELVGASWVTGTLNSFGYAGLSGYLWAWGIFDLILAAVGIYAGYDVLRGGAFGFVIGLVMAGVSATRWFFYIPAAPWTALAIIAIDVLVIYGLISGAEYFERAEELR